MIKQIRQQEDIILYGNILTIEQLESIETVEFLRNEYEREALEYPYTIPPFDEEAALWGAKTVYLTAQLMLYRENRETELSDILPPFSSAISPSVILSADLCLRFIPDMLTQLKLIDSEDALIKLLEDLLQLWHYSGVQCDLKTEELDFQQITSDDCLHQLYINRIIGLKKTKLAKHPAFTETIAANLGIFSKEFWNDLKLEISIDGKN